jgi:hypothetical protein
MGPIADRTKEHLLAGDSSIVRARRYLLDALKDMEAGKSPPGTSDGSQYRARSLRLEAPATTPFAELVESRVWGNRPAAAE